MRLALFCVWPGACVRVPLGEFPGASDGACTLHLHRVLVAGDSEMAFTAALHTYFAVSDIAGVTVEGLGGVTYTDSLQGGVKVVQQGPVVFDREVDRIYLAAPDAAMKVGGWAGGWVGHTMLQAWEQRREEVD